MQKLVDEIPVPVHSITLAPGFCRGLTLHERVVISTARWGNCCQVFVVFQPSLVCVLRQGAP
jgi:hypothetical protein